MSADWTCPCCSPANRGRREIIRAAIGLGAAAGAGAAFASPALAAPPGPRSITLHRLQTGETFSGTYWHDGKYDRDTLQKLNWVLRDPRIEQATPMDPRLFDVLHAVAYRMQASGPFEVVSGYRSPQTNAIRTHQSRAVSRVSLHMSGMASDVRLPGYDAYGLARNAAELQLGGVGLYRADGFVHLDCGPVRRW